MLWEPTVSPFSVSAEEIGLFDAAPVAVLDNVARLVALALKIEIGLVTTVDFSKDRQFFKGLHDPSGPCARSRCAPLAHSFCQYVVRSDRVVAVSDAANDDRFARIDRVGDLGIMSYLGVPFHMPNGTPIGALCVADRRPRKWMAADMVTLNEFQSSIASFVRLCAVNAGTARLAVDQDRMAKAMVSGAGSDVGGASRIMEQLRSAGISRDVTS